ncbi:MAG: hypothetical protein BGO30_08200 [Bacteroidetes bacterium 41-46]|nr:MAG: hypothetical protein BGO30_08200 [Bacteroidetes bacterium 41-46]
MEKKNLLNLNQAVALFNYTEAEVDTVIKMMKNKTELNNGAENVQKQLQEVSKTLKPGELENLEEQLKVALEKDDKDKVKNLQLRIGLLSAEWNKKYAEAEEKILRESINVKLDKITREELVVLIKPKKEVVTMKESERQVVVTNHFSSDMLAFISHILKN